MGTTQSVPAIEDSCQGAARARCHLPAVLPALHQRARGSRLGGLPRVPGADRAAGLPGSPRATERDLLPTHEAGLLPPAAEVLPHAGGRPWGRTAVGQGCPGGGKGGRRRLGTYPQGLAASRRPRGTKLSRCLLCAPPGCPHTDCVTAVLDRAQPSWPSRCPQEVEGCGLEGLLKALQLRTVRAVVRRPALTLHFFPPSVLAAPGSVRPPLPASAPLPLVRQAAAPAPCGSQVRQCPSGVTDRHDREGRQGGPGWIRSPLLPGICVVAMETLPISTYTDGTWRSRHAGLLYMPVHVGMGILWSFHVKLQCPHIVPIFSFSVAVFLGSRRK